MKGLATLVKPRAARLTGLAIILSFYVFMLLHGISVAVMS